MMSQPTAGASHKMLLILIFQFSDLCNGNGMDRTSSVPKSVLCLCVNQGQGLRSGLLSFTSLVLPSNEC